MQSTDFFCEYDGKVQAEATDLAEIQDISKEEEKERFDRLRKS